MGTMRKILVVSYYFPPILSGTAIMLGNLLKYFPRDSFVALTGSASDLPIDMSTKLDCERYVSETPQIPQIRFLGTTFRILMEFLYIPAIVLKGRRIVKRHNLDRIYTIFPKDHFFVAGFLIHKLTGKPLFVHFFDIYDGGRLHWLQKAIARISERIVLRSAVRVFTPSAFLQDHYRRKYQVESEIIPHTVDKSLYDASNSNGLPKEDGDAAKIVFTGAVYDAQRDAVLNLVRTLELMPGKDLKLILCTQTPPASLAQWGICGKNVFCCFVRKDELPRIQRSADILFLPMAFHTMRPLVPKTASPSKMPEYLVSGKPILVHAPEDCYLSHYAREEGFALVVDRLDPHLLKDAIVKLLEDKELCRNLIANAQRTSKKHDAEKVSHDLQNYLIHDL